MPCAWQSRFKSWTLRHSRQNSFPLGGCIPCPCMLYHTSLQVMAWCPGSRVQAPAPSLELPVPGRVPNTRKLEIQPLWHWRGWQQTKLDIQVSDPGQNPMIGSNMGIIWGVKQEHTRQGLEKRVGLKPAGWRQDWPPSLDWGWACRFGMFRGDGAGTKVKAAADQAELHTDF